MFSTKFRTARLDSCRSAKNPTTHCLAPRSLLVGSLAFALIACTSSSTTNGSGGAGGNNNGTGGSSSGGSSGTTNGGSSGSNTGGSAKGGSSGTGGSSSNTGGSAKGGSSGTGGSAKGGSSGTGGSSSNTGGSAKGGSSGTGGSSSNTGGSSGTNNGGSSGTNNGGSSAGGTSGGTGGSAAGGSSGTGTNPPGWYATKDWGVTSVDWHGCVWTGIDSTVSGSTTSISPKDFTSATTEGGPYHVTGTVFNDYNSVAILGFDLNDTPTGDAQQCSNAKRDPTADGPPAVAFPSDATGIAFNWTQGSSTLVRIQIQEADGATNSKHQWCYNITDAGGKSFAEFSKFNTKCWGTEGSTSNPLGTYYTDDGSPKISSIMFMIAGTISKLSPYDFTINGFAPGTSADQAPGTASADCGKQTGTVGSTTQGKDASMMRAKVSGTDCKQYIVQNNNWGNPTGSYQVLSFVGNSFKVTDMNGSGSSAPASFPSIYIGQNGDLAGGTYKTTDSNLPIQISAIKSANSTFKWSGGSGGDYNTTYDIWFSKSSTLPSSYNDGISGLLMVWLYKPTTGKVPIGSSSNTRSAKIGDQEFDVWRGPRAQKSDGTDDANRPVISYVAKSTISNFSGDLKAFFDDAVANAADDMSKGGTSQAFSSSWYLTDVFGGFEIWSNGKGLSNDGFTVNIQK
jgi:hypothetical protein